MLNKKKFETLLKTTLHVEISQKLPRILSCVPSNNYGDIDVKTIYKGDSKDRNMETEWMI